MPSIIAVYLGRTSCGTVTFSLLLVILSGCGGSQPSRHAVSGTVKLDGESLSGARVVFEPRVGGGSVVTVPIVDGTFQCDAPNGLPPGEYDVRINPEAVDEREAMEIMRRRERRPIELARVPPRYQRSGALHATVKADQANRFEFLLEPE